MEKSATKATCYRIEKLNREKRNTINLAYRKKNNIKSFYDIFIQIDHQAQTNEQENNIKMR